MCGMPCAPRCFHYSIRAFLQACYTLHAMYLSDVCLHSASFRLSACPGCRPPELVQLLRVAGKLQSSSDWVPALLSDLQQGSSSIVAGERLAWALTALAELGAGNSQLASAAVTVAQTLLAAPDAVAGMQGVPLSLLLQLPVALQTLQVQPSTAWLQVSSTASLNNCDPADACFASSSHIKTCIHQLCLPLLAMQAFQNATLPQLLHLPAKAVFPALCSLLHMTQDIQPAWVAAAGSVVWEQLPSLAASQPAGMGQLLAWLQRACSKGQAGGGIHSRCTLQPAAKHSSSMGAAFWGVP